VKNSTTKQKRILVVEDEAVIGQLCQRILTGEGFEVNVAGDGKVAQDMIKKQPYDLYLIDIRLPVLGGKELYVWLQEAYPESVGRVVFATGSAMGEDTQSFLQNSGRQVLTKPFTPEELKVRITQALKTVEE